MTIPNNNSFYILLSQAKVARTACVAACQHINKRLLSLMLDDDVKQISLGALRQLELDLIQCERMYIYYRLHL